MSARIDSRLAHGAIFTSASFIALSTSLLSSVTALIVTTLLLMATGNNPVEALLALLAGAFGGQLEVAETVTRAVPLVFTALATAVAYRARLWSVGQEGQLVVGAMSAYAAAQVMGGRGGPLAWMLPMVAGAVGGAAWGLLPAWWKGRRGISEIITTVLLNYVAVYLLTYVIAHWCEKAQPTYLQSDLIPAASNLPSILSETPLNAGFVVALGCAAVITIMLKHSALGFEIRAFGSNPTASRFKGIDELRVVLVVFAISGALAGLCGATQLLSTHERLSLAVVSGVGYAGIIVAMLARLNPIGVLLAALLFGALDTGSAVMQLEAGVPSTLAKAMQASMLFSFLFCEIAVRNFVKRLSQNA